jgi:hypothetical protein
MSMATPLEETAARAFEAQQARGRRTTPFLGLIAAASFALGGVLDVRRARNPT